MRKAVMIAVAAAALLALSCQIPLKLRVAPGSAADDLWFSLSERHESWKSVTGISVGVYPCETVGRPKEYGAYYPADEHAVWVAAAPGGPHATPTNRFAYGRDEHGLETTHGPKPLSTPGCYVMRGSARSKDGHRRVITLRFKVAADGTVAQK